MTAADWARRVTPSAFRRDPEALDREVLAADRDFRVDVDAFLESYRVASYRAMTALDDAIEESDPDRAAVTRPAPHRTLTGLLALLLPMVMVGLVFSRARLEVAGIAPSLAVLFLAAAALSAVAVLPIRTDPPPTRLQVVETVVPTSLGALSVLGSVVRLGDGAVPVVWWLLDAVAFAVVATLSTLVVRARARAPRAIVIDRDGALAARNERVRLARAAASAEWVGRLGELWRSLPEPRRLALAAEQRDALAVLAERGLLEPSSAASPPLVGLLLMESSAIELRPGERLSPDLDGMPSAR